MSREKQWAMPRDLPEDVERELKAYGPIERQILFSRGVRSAAAAEELLGGRLTPLHDPMLLEGMKLAVERVTKAIEDGERIAVYGDYDVDGVTATALMVEVLGSLGARVVHYIPDRFREGYGLNADAIRSLRGQGAELLITVDCGARAEEEVLLARELGLDVVVTDHHAPMGIDVPAVAVVDPKRDVDAYPFKGLSGVGLAYKLAQALVDSMGGGDTSPLLDLVAIGTIADLSPLKGENRTLVVMGLEQLNRNPRPGLRALCDSVHLKAGSVTSVSVGYVLGPRLNAAGRLDSAEKALELLLAPDVERAAPLAQELGRLNRERQRLSVWTVNRAREVGIDEGEDPFLIFADDPEFNEGVVGLAAARLMEEFYRPAVVARRGKETTRGSARSIPEFHVNVALDRCSDLLERHGGHRAAAGFTVATTNLDELKRRLVRLAEEELGGLRPTAKIEVQACVRLGELVSSNVMEFIERLEPCGVGNPRPILAATEVAVVEKRRVGREGNHLKLVLSADRGLFDGIAFRQAGRLDEIFDRVDIAFHLERNDYMGVETLQLNIMDIKQAGYVRGQSARMP